MNYHTYEVACNKVTARFHVQDGSSDTKSVDETWKKSAYRKPKSGFDVEPGDRWLDLGANIGAFTVYAAKRGATVLAVEPEPRNASRIRHHAEINGMEHHINVREAAVTIRQLAGVETPFYVNPNPKAYRRHTLNPNYMGNTAERANQIQVETVSLEDLLDEGYDCIKMNIEGTEIPILMGLSDEYYSKIKKLVFEYSFDMDKRISIYVRVLKKISPQFTLIKESRKIDKTKPTFDHYPPNVYIFGLKKQ